MKAITCEVILSSIRTKADNSLGLSFSTPELAPDEVMAFIQIKNMNLKMLLQPMGEEVPEVKEIKNVLAKKTQSERVRGTLFVWWKQLGEPGEWETFYRHETEKILDQIKSHLNPA